MSNPNAKPTLSPTQWGLVGLLVIALGIGGYFLLSNDNPDLPTGTVPNGSETPIDGTAETNGEGGERTPHAMTVYFTQVEEGTPTTVATKRVIPTPLSQSASYANHQQQVQFALKSLLQGPTAAEQAEGIYSEIPKGTQLLGVNETAKVITVNLSQPFEEGAGAHSLVQRVEEIRATLAPLANGKEVRLQVEGKSLTMVGSEGLELDTPFIPSKKAAASAQKPANTNTPPSSHPSSSAAPASETSSAAF